MKKLYLSSLLYVKKNQPPKILYFACVQFEAITHLKTTIIKSVRFISSVFYIPQPKHNGYGSYVKDEPDGPMITCLVFSLINDKNSGTLVDSLSIFKKHKVNLTHIETRSSNRVSGYEFLVECDSNAGCLSEAIEKLKEICSYFSVISRDHLDNTSTVPWFPKKIRDLDRFANQILSYGADLESDHPGFTDEVYTKRR